MVNLNENQKRTIEDLAHAKRVYDTKVEELEAEMRRLRSALKDPIRALVRKAREESIPERQVHVYGLGMAQRQQMYTFLMTPEDKAGLDDAYRNLLYSTPTETAAQVGRFGTNPAAVSWEWRGIDKSGKMWEATSPDGTKYGINLLTAGKISVIKPNKDKPGQYAEWTPELIRAAKAYNKKWLTMEDYAALSHVEDDEEDED